MNSYDSPYREDRSQPQRVSIVWAMETPDDEHSNSEFAMDPTNMDAGFFPSLDRNDCGFVGDGVTIAEFGTMQDAANERAEAFGDSWSYVGVVAKAIVYIPIGGGAFTVHTMRSAGVWGVESDSGDYLRTLYEEQREDLLSELRTLGAALASGDFDQR